MFPVSRFYILRRKFSGFTLFTHTTRSRSVIPSGVTSEFTIFPGCEVTIRSMVEADVAVVRVAWSIS